MKTESTVTRSMAVVLFAVAIVCAAAAAEPRPGAGVALELQEVDGADLDELLARASVRHYFPADSIVVAHSGLPPLQIPVIRPSESYLRESGKLQAFPTVPSDPYKCNILIELYPDLTCHTHVSCVLCV